MLQTISRLLVLTAVPGLTIFFEPELKAAASYVTYLQQVPVMTWGGRYACLQIPLDASRSPPCPGPVGYYDSFNLPGYGSAISVAVTPNVAGGAVPQLTWGHEKIAELQSTSNGSYRWGTDTNFFHFENISSQAASYTITFYFNGVNPPAPSDLFLPVAGLASGTTAKLSPQTGTNEGEDTLDEAGLFTSPTAPPTAANGWTFGSTWNYVDTTDQYNTGWDLYQPNSPGLRVLSLNVNQEAGDGLGLTLAYRACAGLVGISGIYPAPASSLFILYDISTSTGAATNPRPLGRNLDWGIAFSPLQPSGILYSFARSSGELFVVDPVTGTGTPLILTGIPGSFAGGFAADPTSGTLYAMDENGKLYTAGSAAPANLAGRITGVPPALHTPFFAAMAFDHAGNLFVIDTANAIVLALNKTTAAVVGTIPLKNAPSMTPYVSAGLAIDPWSAATGTAYFAYGDGRILYTFNLTGINAGAMTSVGPLTGVSPAGSGLTGLTFMESTVNGSGACTANRRNPLPFPSPVPDQT